MLQTCPVITSILHMRKLTTGKALVQSQLGWHLSPVLSSPRAELPLSCLPRILLKQNDQVIVPKTILSRINPHLFQFQLISAPKICSPRSNCSSSFCVSSSCGGQHLFSAPCTLPLPALCPCCLLIFNSMRDPVPIGEKTMCNWRLPAAWGCQGRKRRLTPRQGSSGRHPCVDPAQHLILSEEGL